MPLATLVVPVTPVGPACDAPAFDPYAFNTINLYKREGRHALADRLAGVETAGQLRQIADAQRLSLDEEVLCNGTPAQLRESIIAGVEQWIANRRAAAS